METLFIAFVVTFAAACGSHSQLTIARFASDLDRTAPLLATGLASAGLGAAVMAVLGSSAGPLLEPPLRYLAIASVLSLAAFRLVSPVRVEPMQEPTRSFVAIGIVLFFRQLGEAPFLLVLVIALAEGVPGPAFAGGAAGGGAALALGWSAGFQALAALPQRLIRLSLALTLVISAFAIGIAGSTISG